MTYINTPTHAVHDSLRYHVEEYDLPYRRCPQKRGDDTLTPQQIYHRLQHCQKTTKALLRTLEPYDNLSKPLCGLIVDVIGEEICCIDLARRYQDNRDMSRRVRELENVLESYDDLLCHQSLHGEERIIGDAQKIARRWRSRPPSTRGDSSSCSSSDSITDCSFDDWEHSTETGALTKSQLVDYLQELVKAENEVWRDMKEVQKSQPAQSEWHTPNSPQFDNSRRKQRWDIRASPLLLQAERASSLEALDHDSRNHSVSSSASTREASPAPEERCAKVGEAMRRRSSLPEPADMSSRHAMLRWLKTSAQQQHPNEEPDSSGGESPAHQHQAQKTTTTTTMTTPEEDEEQQERRKKHDLDEAVEKLRKLGHGEIRIPEPTGEDRGRTGRSDCARDEDEDEDEEDNAVLRELKMARRQRWGSADATSSGSGGWASSDSDSGS
ncbi:hypothetical protein F4775DRAFT_304819 [Biscogniauxia sp. FL1348]|nr:hypothetical protein F4775DRAFT_304819 [Biscogniauxia sp. FL1348]